MPLVYKALRYLNGDYCPVYEIKCEFAVGFYNDFLNGFPEQFRIVFLDRFVYIFNF